MNSNELLVSLQNWGNIFTISSLFILLRVKIIYSQILYFTFYTKFNRGWAFFPFPSVQDHDPSMSSPWPTQCRMLLKNSNDKGSSTSPERSSNNELNVNYKKSHYNVYHRAHIHKWILTMNLTFLGRSILIDEATPDSGFHWYIYIQMCSLT